MRDKAVDGCSIGLEFVPDQYKTHEMCDRIISDNLFSLRYAPDQYKSQQRCDDAARDFLPTLSFFPIGLLKVKRLKSFLLFCMEMKIYSTLMKILVTLYLLAMKWVLLRS